MSDLSKAEVFKGVAAGEFAAASLLYLDVLVTLDFARMGIAESEEARGELQRFLKAANSWLNERRLPVAWLASIECDRKGGLHAHIALHVPGMREEGGKLHGTRHRTHFRRWAREAAARRIGEVIPKAVNVRCSLKSSIISHWICVTYLLKGYDRSAILMGARNRDDGEDLRLGDILPFPYRSAGDVGLERRLWVSGNLGPAKRRGGIPSRLESNLCWRPDILSLEVSTAADVLPRSEPVPEIIREPFRSAVEDGVYDIRQIYGEEFAAFVCGLKPPPEPAGPIPPDLYSPDLLTFLADLGV